MPLALMMGLLCVAALVLAATQTWRLKERQRDQEKLERSSRVIEEERRVLELIAKGASLKEVLDALTAAIERMATDCYCTVLLLDEEGKRLWEGSGGGLPAAYMQAVNGLEIGPEVGACGSAAYRNETTIIEDIANDHRFGAAKGFVMSFGLRACWSVPIRDSKQKVLGTFAMYHKQPASRSLPGSAGGGSGRALGRERHRTAASRGEAAGKRRAHRHGGKGRGLRDLADRPRHECLSFSEGFAALVALTANHCA